MNIEAYPVMRLPRRFGAFDYELPDGMDVERGTFVRVPFRSRTTLAIVARVRGEAARGRRVKQVESVVSDIPAFSSAELDALERVAADAAQSVGSILYAAIPRWERGKADVSLRALPARPLTVPAREAGAVGDAAKRFAERSSAFVRVPDLRRSSAFVAALRRVRPGEPTLVLAPNVRDARLAAERLGALHPFVVTGEETARDRMRAWRAWRSGTDPILVGTRTAALWTHPRLGSIVILRASHENHRQTARNPRLDVRVVADILGNVLGARVARLDVAPRVSDVARFGTDDRLGLETRPPTLLADMGDERRRAAHPRVGPSAVMRIAETLSSGRRVLCAYNVRGNVRRLTCDDCGFRFPPDSVPAAACPSCAGTRIRPRGFGLRAVAAAIQSLFPEATVRCLEKAGEPITRDAWPDILVTTRQFVENVFDPFDPPDVGLVADLDADLALYDAGLGATERALMNAEEWRGVANACRADALFQTDVPERLRSLLSDPYTALAAETEARRAYGQPPFRRIVEISPEASAPAEAADALARRAEREVPGVEAHLTDAGSVRLSIAPDRADTLLSWCALLDDSIVVDTHADE